MNVACSSCPAKYAVPDEKVRGRKVRITCKRCGAPIIVDGTQASAFESVAAPEPSAPAAEAARTGKASPGPQPQSGGEAAGGSPASGGAPAATEGHATKVTGSPVAAELAAVEAAAKIKAEAKPAGIAGAAAGAGKLAGAATKLPAVGRLGDAKAAGFPKPAALAGKSAGLGTKAAPGAFKPAASGAASTENAGEPSPAAPASTEPAEKDSPAAAGGRVAAMPVAARAAVKAGTGAAASGGQAQRAVAVPRAGAAARAIAPSALPERTWTVAVTDDDHREMTLPQIVGAYAAQTIDAETFVWRDGMQDWLMPFEIGEIASALRARRLSPRTNAPAGGSTESLPFGEEAGGAAGTWREPGRWDREEPPPSEANFDDVTVAMAAPKAQALLDAVAAEEAAAAHGPKSDGPTAVAPPFAVTPEALGFGDDDEPDGAAAKAPEATAPDDDAEREPEKLPFELAPSAVAGRAMLRSESGVERTGARTDLFARRSEEAEAATDSGAPESVAAESEPAEGNPALTGARNETSVLFSLDQLSKTKDTKAPAGKPGKKKAEEAAILLGGSSQGAAGLPPATMTGGLFGQTSMAAPDFTAPPPPSVPPAAPGKSPATSSGTPPAAKQKSSTGLWLALLVVVVGGTGAAVFFTRSPPPAPTASPEAIAPAAVAPTAVAPTAIAPTASVESPATSAAPDESAAPTTSASGAPVASGAATASGAAPVPSVAASAAATSPAPVGRPQSAAAPKPSAAAEPAVAEGPDFDKDAASTALAGAAARAESECASQEGPHGSGKVSVTFVNSGRATNALVSGDFAGSALGGCIARVFRSAKVPSFGGDSVRVSKTVRIP